ncbi:hypothetical protein Glove_344g94 [Diversispora epigaea]|uniref:Uncharacterized protein n=1 Tax=Diversispora epigaea TaxID=1348612 RepID=A0A397HGF1_9GLOM|nr:hypothetical protein Glove_344g94 [Diversispora epigaea]
MPKRKKIFMRLQEYNNKRRQISVDKNKETEINEEFETDEENVEAKEREEKKLKRKKKYKHNKKFLNEFAGASSNGYVNEPTISFLISPMPSNSLAEMDENLILSERIVQLQCDLLRNRKTLTAFEYNRQRAIYKYFIQLNDSNGKMKSSEEAANIVYINPKLYTAKWIHSLIKFFLNYNSFPISNRNKYQKYK